MKDVFARFDMDLGESANWYVQGSWAQAENLSDWIQWVVSPSAGRPNSIFSNNPYITPATQALLGSGIECGTAGAMDRLCLPAVPATSPQTGSTPPPPPAGAGNVPYFRLPSYIWNQVDGEPANGSPNRLYRTIGDQKQWNAETGATGSFGDWNWDVYYNHGNSELTVTNPNNTDNAKYLASLDAVLDGGTIRCWVSTQPQFAGLYPGCVPTNITNPAGPSAESYDYLRTPTSWTLTQELDDVGFSIGGGLWGFGLPAGEIIANVSGEARWATYVMESDFLPSDFVNCTGLRFCLANGDAPLRWVQNTNAEVDAKNHVYESALNSTFRCSKTSPGSRTSRPTCRVDAPSIRPSTRAIPGSSDSTGKSSIRCGCAAPIRPTSARRTSTICTSLPASRRPVSRTGSRAAAARACASSRAAIRT